MAVQVEAVTVTVEDTVVVEQAGTVTVNIWVTVLTQGLVD